MPPQCVRVCVCAPRASAWGFLLLTLVGMDSCPALPRERLRSSVFTQHVHSATPAGGSFALVAVRSWVV